jgi:hypothetical protein
MIVTVFGVNKTNLVQYSLQTWTILSTKSKMLRRGMGASNPIEPAVTVRGC